MVRSAYSSPRKIYAVKNEIADTTTKEGRPLMVLDLDGNVLLGYNTVDGEPLQKEGLEKGQNIPWNADIDQLLKEGKIIQTIFAEKPSDVRLPKDLVDQLNANLESGRIFDIAILTSRDLGTAEKILEASGVKNPKGLAFFADSGALGYVNGQSVATYKFETGEKDFLNGVAALKEECEAAVNRVLTDEKLEIEGRKELYIEPKNTAINIHYRDILGHYSPKEGSELDKALSAELTKVVNKYLENSPKTIDGKPVFKTLGAPAAVEVKVAAVDKGKGLKAITKEALKAGVKPSAIVYAGDDICKINDAGEVLPGTDYHAFRDGPKIAQELGVKFYGIHTLHPANGKLPTPQNATGFDPRTIDPNPDKTVWPMSDAEHYPDISNNISLTLTSPIETGKLVKEIGILSEKAATKGGRGPASTNSRLPSL